jgi:hypothetical protein
LGLLDFMRVPCPAARTMAVMLSFSISIPYFYALYVPKSFSGWIS